MSAVRSNHHQGERDSGGRADHTALESVPLDQERDVFSHTYAHRRPNYSTHASSQLEAPALDRVNEVVNEVSRDDQKSVLSPLPAMPYQLSSQSTVALSSNMSKTGSSGSDASSKEHFSEAGLPKQPEAPDHPSPWVHCKHFQPDFNELGWHRAAFAVLDYGAAQAGLPLIPMTYTPGPAPIQLRPIWAFAGMVFLNSLGFILAIPWILIFVFLFIALGLASLPTIFLPLSIGRDLAPNLWTPLEYLFAAGAIFGLAVPYTVLWVVYTTLFVVFWPFNFIFSLPCSQVAARKLVARMSRLRWPYTSYKTRSAWVNAYFDRQPASTDVVGMAGDMFNNAWFFLLAWPADIGLRLTFTFLAMPQYMPLLWFLYVPGWTALAILIMRKFKDFINFNFIGNVCEQAAPSMFPKHLSESGDFKAEREADEARGGAPTPSLNRVYTLHPSHTLQRDHQAVAVGQQHERATGFITPYYQQANKMYDQTNSDGTMSFGGADTSTSTFFKQGLSTEHTILTPRTQASESPHVNMMGSLAYDSRFTIGSDGMGSPIRKNKQAAEGGELSIAARHRGGYGNDSPNVTLDLDRVVTRNDGGRISGELHDAQPNDRLPPHSKSARARSMSGAGAGIGRKLSKNMSRGGHAGQRDEQHRMSPHGYRHLADEGPDMRRQASSDAEESFETATGGYHGAANGRTIRFIQPNDRGYYQ